MSLANKSLTLYPPVSSKYGVSYSHEAPITIAPLTLTVPIGVTKITDKNLSSMLQAAATQDLSPPQPEFDIREKLPGPLTIVRNQGNCGSCWAFSSATAMGDCVTKQLLGKKNPPKDSIRISPASFLNTTGMPWANGCQGGNPLNAAKYMKDNNVPLVTDSCSDYSWYLVPYINQTPENECDSCNQIMQQYQGIGGGGTDMGPPCLMKPEKGEHWQFRIKDYVTMEDSSGNFLITQSQPDDLNSINTNISTSIKNRHMMQQFLLKHGSFPVGISLFAGFMPGGGNFQNPSITSKLKGADANISWVKKTGDMKVNVYVQDMQYDQDIVGGHAVTVVGWANSEAVHNRALANLDKCFGPGEGKKISDKVSAILGKNQKFPLGWYWIIRNSWGTVWPSGQNTGGGYFGLAMYPSNLLSQWTLPYQSPRSNDPWRPTSNKYAYQIAAANPNSKTVLFSIFCGIVPGEICGGPDSIKCKDGKKLESLSNNTCSSGKSNLLSSQPSEVKPLFDTLDKMIPKKSNALVAGRSTKARVMEATHADDDTIANWSNYLSEKASKLKDRECIYAKNSEDVTPNKPSPGGYLDPDKKGLSTGAIIGISVGALVIILSILFALFH
jgi:hypothetical protein